MAGRKLTNPKQQGLTLSGYARWRKDKGLPGGSRTTVSRAVASGRIPTLPDGSIDPSAADRAWIANTDDSKRNRPSTGLALVEPEPETAAPVEVVAASVNGAGAGAEADPFEVGAMTQTEARRVKEMAAAGKGQLQYRRLKGDLIDRRRAEMLVFGLARRERDAWLGWPARIAADLAAHVGDAVDAHKLETCLIDAVRAELQRRAELSIDFGADDDAGD